MTEQEALAAALDRSSGLDQLHPNDAFGAGFHAALAWLRSQGEPVAWEYRTWYGENTVTPGWSEWLRVEPRNPFTDTVDDRVAELKLYIERGYKYEVRPLFIAPQPAIPEGWQSKASRDVLAERRRQVEGEGWTTAHDDEHADGELAEAAACYCCSTTPVGVPDFWPWHHDWWKPEDPRRNLVKAGALILAEIERLDRTSTAAPKPGESS